ncbi:acyl-CoA dehydrogenase family protein [Pseudofrankia asymbiotica]|uniref:acyl-CoA dehydrogenase family protein n=1 Tax=Pseudofrankia asymbiotica TaxID=1834516 RepID=UPI0009769090|nr:acyl-CoA dehydrogenase family protein [Pseudofrankia asymbiotica]
MSTSTPSGGTPSGGTPSGGAARGLLDRAFPPPRLGDEERGVLDRLQVALDERVEPAAAEHDARGRYPASSIAALKPTGITFASLPRDLGGIAASHRLTLEAQVRMAVADSSVAQIFRVHEDCVRELHVTAGPALRTRLGELLATERKVVGLAAAENGRRVDSPMTTLARRRDDGSYVLDGTKIYTTGAAGADLIAVAAFDPVAGAEDPIAGIRTFLVPPGAPGVRVAYDWDALGQRATESGTITFTAVEVEPPLGGLLATGLMPHSGPRFQAGFAAELVGLGVAALRAAAPFVRDRSRPWPSADTERASGDPTVRALTGELTADLVAAYTAVIATGDLLDAFEAGEIDRTQLAVPIYAAKATASRAALRATSEIFALMGTRSAKRELGFDRFWRNARTLSLHDPVAWKHVEIGRHVLEGWEPEPGLYQ